MSGQAKNLKPVLISDGGVKVHYKDYRRRGRGNIFSPLCNVAGAGHPGKEWRLDDGLGADICGRCVSVWDRLRAIAIEKDKERRKAQNKKAMREGGENYRAHKRKYFEETRETQNKKARYRYWQDPEKYRARARKYYQQKKEREGAQ